jgi:hypothetical protein
MCIRDSIRNPGTPGFFIGACQIPPFLLILPSVMLLGFHHHTYEDNHESIVIAMLLDAGIGMYRISTEPCGLYQ